jgi:hypothetical protein
MKKIIIIICFLFLGCDGMYKEITAEQAAKEKEICQKHGMKYEVLTNPKGHMSKINCR